MREGGRERERESGREIDGERGSGRRESSNACSSCTRLDASRACAGWSPLFIRLSIVMSLYMPAYEQVRRRILKMGYFE